VVRSKDGGGTWARTLPGVVTGLEAASNNFNNQYASIGDWLNANDVADKLANGIYRSTDGGQTWSLVTGPWGVATTASSPFGRIELALSRSNPNVLYASIARFAGDLLGLYRTDNAWA